MAHLNLDYMKGFVPISPEKTEGIGAAAQDNHRIEFLKLEPVRDDTAAAGQVSDNVFTSPEVIPSPTTSPESDTGTPNAQTSTASPELSHKKPSLSYVGIIAKALLTVPNNKGLLLHDIYNYICKNYPYFKNNKSGWKNSIRHNLSLNECFIKASKADIGKGHYWAIHPACVEDFTSGNYKRTRARRRAMRHTAYVNAIALGSGYGTTAYNQQAPAQYYNQYENGPYFQYNNNPMMNAVPVSAAMMNPAMMNVATSSASSSNNPAMNQNYNGLPSCQYADNAYYSGQNYNMQPMVNQQQLYPQMPFYHQQQQQQPSMQVNAYPQQGLQLLEEFH